MLSLQRETNSKNNKLMANKKEKILTKNLVYELGLDKVSVITADMLEGYTSIGGGAFLFCSSLTSIEIPNSVTSIGDSAFFGCAGLTSVTIPNSVTSIEYEAFHGCSGLKSIEIPDSVTSIGKYAFYDCTRLAYPVYNAHVFAFMPTSYSGAYTIPDGIESIAGGAFYNCNYLTSITIPNSVTNIGISVFYNCTSLTSVTISDSVTTIELGAFYGCNSLPYVTIGNKTYKPQTVTNGKCKAYKGFNADMTCRGFQYKEGETYEYEGEPELCICGFHASLCLLDVFNYYCGKIDKDVVVYEVELEGVADERNEFDSKVVAKKITIGKRIL